MNEAKLRSATLAVRLNWHEWIFAVCVVIIAFQRLYPEAKFPRHFCVEDANDHVPDVEEM